MLHPLRALLRCLHLGCWCKSLPKPRRRDKKLSNKEWWLREFNRLGWEPWWLRSWQATDSEAETPNGSKGY